MSTTRQRLGRWSAIAALLLAAISCGGGDGGTDPAKPGEYSVVVEAVDTKVGGALVTVVVPGLQAMSVLGHPYLQADSTATTRVIVLRGRPIAGATILNLRVTDRKQVPTVIVSEVAAGASGGYAALEVGTLSLSIVGPKQ